MIFFSSKYDFFPGLLWEKKSLVGKSAIYYKNNTTEKNASFQFSIHSLPVFVPVVVPVSFIFAHHVPEGLPHHLSLVKTGPAQSQAAVIPRVQAVVVSPCQVDDVSVSCRFRKEFVFWCNKNIKNRVFFPLLEVRYFLFSQNRKKQQHFISQIPVVHEFILVLEYIYKNALNWTNKKGHEICILKTTYSL